MTLDEALAAVSADASSADGIGTLGEKTLHATLKLWLDADVSHHEIPLPNGYVADIFDGACVTEIQTANFSGFRRKLERLLEQYPVTVVHPLVREKYICWIDPMTGAASEPRRSTRRGSLTDAGQQLVYILPLLRHPRLTIRLLLLDVQEHRLLDGWGNGGKRGAHRVERYPLALVDSVVLHSPADYAALLPPLAYPCSAAQFGKAAHLQGRKLSGTLKVLLAQEILTREKQGRGYVYCKK